MSLTTEPLRAEHRELLPRLTALDRTPSELAAWNTAEALDHLGSLTAFLQDDLVPHARAEEAVLYPAVDEAMGAPEATATMRADHAEIGARIDRLERTLVTVAERWPDPDLIDDVALQLAGLRAIVRLHFHKEEDVLLPLLDRALTPQTAEDLFSRMSHAAHPG